jgi:arsenate reductase-like glutaredoxin family protein
MWLFSPILDLGVTGKIKSMQSVQIFGVKSSQDARAAERFFKERRVQIHMVDLAQKPMAPGEIKRFVDKFGLLGLVDTDGKAYADAGLKYLRVTDTELLRKIEEQPKLLKLPLVRSGNRICIGRDEKGWTGMLEV